jgi:hypothetical protein
MRRAALVAVPCYCFCDPLAGIPFLGTLPFEDAADSGCAYADALGDVAALHPLFGEFPDFPDPCGVHLRSRPGFGRGSVGCVIFPVLLGLVTVVVTVRSRLVTVLLPDNPLFCLTFPGLVTIVMVFAEAALPLQRDFSTITKP